MLYACVHLCLRLRAQLHERVRRTQRGGGDQPNPGRVHRGRGAHLRPFPCNLNASAMFMFNSITIVTPSSPLVSLQATVTQDVWVPKIHPEFASAAGGGGH